MEPAANSSLHSTPPPNSLPFKALLKQIYFLKLTFLSFFLKKTSRNIGFRNIIAYIRIILCRSSSVPLNISCNCMAPNITKKDQAKYLVILNWVLEL